MRPDITAEVLAALREALAGVAHHGRATRVEVVVRVGERLLLQVIHDGTGPAPARSSGGGLGEMARRAERLGGSCDASTAPGGGTVLHWTVPLPPAAWAVRRPGA